jgi:hypothetical protein
VLNPAGAALLDHKTTAMKKVILVGFVGGMISFLMFLLSGLIVSGFQASHL